jgi:hypothetical protein
MRRFAPEFMIVGMRREFDTSRLSQATRCARRSRNLQRERAAYLRSSGYAEQSQATKPAPCPSAEGKGRAKQSCHDKNFHAITLLLRPKGRGIGPGEIKNMGY